MNLWMLAGLAVIVILFIMLGLVCLQILRRQNQLAARLQNQEKNAAQQAALVSSQAQAHFETVSSQMQQLNREQAQNAALMDAVYGQMDTINKVMTNTKMRGSWGEYQMEHLIRAYAGDNDALYEVQYHLDNGKIADGAFHMPGTDKVFCIDSKFPMENFLKMEEDPEKSLFWQKEFIRNMKKHIDDVSRKYITPQTASQALLFIPSESIYQYICSGEADLLRYALRQRVLLVSPTTLCGVIYSLMAAGKEYYQACHIQDIEQELATLQEQFAALQIKADKAQRALQSAQSAQSSLISALDKALRQMSRVLEGKEWPHVTEGSRFKSSETQPESLSGASGVSGGSGLFSDR